MRCTRCKQRTEKGHRHKYHGGVYCDKCIETVSPEAKQRAEAREESKLSNTQMAKDLDLVEDLKARGL